MIVRIRNKLRNFLTFIQMTLYRKIWNMDIGEDCKISLKARLDRTNPKGLHIGKETGIAFGASILTHDFINGVHKDTWIGNRCHIGINAVVRFCRKV